MNELRQRRASRGSEDISEPLLGGDSAGYGSAPMGTDEDGDAPFDFWHWILSLLASFGLCDRPSPRLTPTQRRRLDEIAARVDVPYDSFEDSHRASLLELWNLTFPNDPRPAEFSDGGVKHPKWKEMGWQGVDPATDFRSGGLLSLHNLIWLAKHERGVYDRLLRKTDGTRSEWEYPFAAAGVNVTHALCDELQLRPTRRRTRGNGGNRVAPEEGQPHASYSPAPNAPAAVAFTHMLRKGHAGAKDAFERVYAAWFEALDREWLDRGATYMEFGEVMNATRNKVRGALERAGRRNGGCTVEGLREELGLT